MTNEELVETLTELRRELDSIKATLGMNQTVDETSLPDLRCKSIKIEEAGKELIHIGSQYGSGLILLHSTNGAFLEIQGQYPDIIRIKDNGHLMVSIGADSPGCPDSNGSIRTHCRGSKAFAVMRATKTTGYVDTYSDDSKLTGRIPKSTTDIDDLVK